MTECAHDNPASTKERRGELRQITVLRAGILHLKGSKQLCLVRNISSGGLMARVYSSLEVEEILEVELRPGELLAASVTWKNESSVGLKFAVEVDVPNLLATPWVAERHHRPRVPRIAATARCRIREGSRIYTAQLKNISLGGVGLNADVNLAGHTELIVSIPDLPPLRALLRWSDGQAAGLSFAQPLRFESLALWLRNRGGGPAALGERQGSASTRVESQPTLLGA